MFLWLYEGINDVQNSQLSGWAFCKKTRMSLGISISRITVPSLSPSPPLPVQHPSTLLVMRNVKAQGLRSMPLVGKNEKELCS